MELQPLNATSHWRNGEAAASVRAADLANTGVGLATHVGATLFWAMLFEIGVQRKRSLAPLPMVRDVLLMSAFAAAVDCGAMPKRFTPGWEFVLSKRAMAMDYAALGLGMAAGALLAPPRAP